MTHAKIRLPFYLSDIPLSQLSGSWAARALWVRSRDPGGDGQVLLVWGGGSNLRLSLSWQVSAFPSAPSTYNNVIGKNKSDTILDLLLLLKSFFKINLFIYFWLHWVFVAVRGLLTAVASLVVDHEL